MSHIMAVYHINLGISFNMANELFLSNLQLELFVL